MIGADQLSRSTQLKSTLAKPALPAAAATINRDDMTLIDLANPPGS